MDRSERTTLNRTPYTRPLAAERGASLPTSQFGWADPIASKTNIHTVGYDSVIKSHLASRNKPNTIFQVIRRVGGSERLQDHDIRSKMIPATKTPGVHHFQRVNFNYFSLFPADRLRVGWPQGFVYVHQIRPVVSGARKVSRGERLL